VAPTADRDSMVELLKLYVVTLGLRKLKDSMKFCELGLWTRNLLIFSQPHKFGDNDSTQSAVARIGKGRGLFAVSCMRAITAYRKRP